ncbi:hypothetical protein SAMN05443663_11091 [Flavobacterium defluvii]|uniref:Beta-lactamase-inhibitor-like, PepSY-like n=2 Tax=Flavobacterium defluvii TaxID=370979 RepID=A0A1M5VAH7_9FLAO|nr:hypothetical protein SAMN05443663_11091 [Flavobacterium defluvii]
MMIYLCCSFLSAQTSMLQPSETIKAAFTKQYPKKNPYWTMEMGKNDSDIRFVAKFITNAKTQAYAVYDSDGNLKAYKESISSAKLPKNIQVYLNANYLEQPKPVSNTKSKSKAKIKAKVVNVPIKEAYSVVDDKNNKTYEVKAKKEGKNFNLVFDAEGNLIRTIQLAQK